MLKPIIFRFSKLKLWELELLNFFKTGLKHDVHIEDNIDDTIAAKSRKRLIKEIYRGSIIPETHKQKRIFFFSTKEYSSKLKNIDEAQQNELVKGVNKLANFYNAKNSVYTEKFRKIDCYLQTDLRDKEKLKKMDELFEDFCHRFFIENSYCLILQQGLLSEDFSSEHKPSQKLTELIDKRHPEAKLEKFVYVEIYTTYLDQYDLRITQMKKEKPAKTRFSKILNFIQHKNGKVLYTTGKSMPFWRHIVDTRDSIEGR